MLETIRNDAKGKRLRLGFGLLRGLPISKNAW